MNNTDNADQENNDFTPKEISATRVAWLSLLSTPMVSLIQIFFVDRENGSWPYWTNFLPFLGSVLGSLICYMVFKKYAIRENASTKRIKDALNLNVISTVAVGLTFLVFAGSFDGPEALLPLICLSPFIYIFPIIGLIMAFSRLPKFTEQDQK